MFCFSYMEVILQLLSTDFLEYNLSTIFITIISGTLENENSWEFFLSLETDSPGIESRNRNFNLYEYPYVH